MIKYRSLKKYKYQLLERYCIQISARPPENIKTPFIRLKKTGKLQILKGYAWDGASGPTWDDKKNMRGSLVHDCCYQLIREAFLSPTYREAADKLFKEILVEDGMSKIRVWYYYKAVRLFAGSAAKSKVKYD